ncbi:MAG: glycosyltransferase, partial [Microgenomates group bacterium]
MSSEHIQLSVIIVSFNTAKLTLQTVQSVIDDAISTPSLSKSTEIILIDNNSIDDTLKEINSLKKQTKFPITIIRNHENLGFAAANNQGIATSKGSCILLLNSDTVVKSKTLVKLVSSLEPKPSFPNLGIVAASLQNDDGSYQSQGGSIPTLVRLATQMLGIDDIPVLGTLLPSIQETRLIHSHLTKQNDVLSGLYQVGWVGGTAMMIRRSVVETIGDLDDSIFMYAEDIEYCMRAHDHHIACAIHSGAPIVHLKNASGSEDHAIVGEAKGILYLWAKHRPL